MEFIENNEKYGIKYDLSKIAKEYKRKLSKNES